MQKNVLILDFGSQYTQLIARRVRELNIYCEIYPYNKIPENLEAFKAVILSGSPFSVRAADVLHPDLSKIKGHKPLLGVCYGAQYLAHFNGGSVEPSNIREYGRANLSEISENENLHSIGRIGLTVGRFPLAGPQAWKGTWWARQQVQLIHNLCTPWPSNGNTMRPVE